MKMHILPGGCVCSRKRGDTTAPCKRDLVEWASLRKGAHAYD
jgi:hypothetical protein